jgi:hypothetical protein
MRKFYTDKVGRPVDVSRVIPVLRTIDSKDDLLSPMVEKNYAIVYVFAILCEVGNLRELPSRC